MNDLICEKCGGSRYYCKQCRCAACGNTFATHEPAMTAIEALKALEQQWRTKAVEGRRYGDAAIDRPVDCAELYQDAKRLDACADALASVIAGMEPPQGQGPHLDMLQVDRLRTWARNIREGGGHDISMWGRPSFVAEECERIANDIEAQIKAAAPVDLPQGPQGWQPIATVPQDGTCLLLLDMGGNVNVGYWCQQYTEPFHAVVRGDDANWDDDGGTNPIFNATHWMPLPPPPPQETRE